MKRVLVVVLGVVVVVLGARAIFRALSSDETKIARLLESMQEGYNEGDIGDAIGPLADDWRHEGLSFTRKDIHAGLVREFFQDRDPKTKKLVRRVALDTDTLVVLVTGDSATFEVDVRFERTRKGEWDEPWKARVSGDLKDGPNGWFIHRTRHVDIEGTPASR